MVNRRDFLKHSTADYLVVISWISSNLAHWDLFKVSNGMAMEESRKCHALHSHKIVNEGPRWGTTDYVNGRSDCLCIVWSHLELSR